MSGRSSVRIWFADTRRAGLLVSALVIIGLIPVFTLFGHLSSSGSSTATFGTGRFQTFCGTTSSVQYGYTADLPGKIEYNKFWAVNHNSYEIFHMNFQFKSTGQQGCWPWVTNVRSTFIEISLKDSAGNTDWIGGQFPDWYSFAYAHHDLTPPIVTFNTMNQDIGGGWKLIGWFKLDWPMQSSDSWNVTVPFVVWNWKAQDREGDQVQFKIQYTLVLDSYNGLWWFGNNPSTEYSPALPLLNVTQCTLGPGTQCL